MPPQEDALYLPADMREQAKRPTTPKRVCR